MTKSTDLLEINRGLFVRMKELALDQERLIADDQIKEFLDLMHRRDRLQNEIEKNTMKLRSLAKKRSCRQEEQKNDVISREIAIVIQSIQDIDQRIEGCLSANKETLLSEIKGFRQGQKALKGYGGHQMKKSKFFSTMG